MTQLILKREPIDSNSEDYDVLEDGGVVGRIFLSPGAPQTRGHYGDIRHAAHGYEPTREAAMQAFKRSWHRES
jgi:hypothetical protein